MNHLIRLTLALAGVASVSAFAADAPQLSAADVAYHQAEVAKVMDMRSKLSSTKAKAMGNSTYPGTPMANPFRAYPPSCAADPLPDKASGPYYSKQVQLYVPLVGGATTETVTVTVWRLACSSTGSPTTYNPTGAYNAMTLMRIDRPSDNQSMVPTFPLVQASQGSIGFDSVKSLIRPATEPNTVISEQGFNSPLYVSTTYVLENYPYEGSGYFTFSDGFTLRVDPRINGVSPVDISVPAYEPTQDTYPDAFAPLPLDGYAAAQWVNTDLNHGLIVQVAEAYDAAHPRRRQLAFDLLTEDQNGDPFWLIGNAAFDDTASGTTSLTVQAAYLDNGLQQKPWGTATFEMTNCNVMTVTFTPQAGLPAPVPTFSGPIDYGRLLSANGMLCE
jgi:hypothetical protein